MTDPRVAWARRWDRLWALWFMILVIIIPSAAWMQHILTTAGSQRWGVMLFGAIVFPIGVLHGLCIWLGVFD